MKSLIGLVPDITDVWNATGRQLGRIPPINERVGVQIAEQGRRDFLFVGGIGAPERNFIEYREAWIGFEKEPEAI
jgi:1,6-anhydro-N-acetylmuramate kinase